MPKKSKKRTRSRSNSSELSGISKILRRIEDRLDNVEKRQFQFPDYNRTRRRVLSSSSSDSGASERGRSRQRQSRQRDAKPSSSRALRSMSVISSESDDPGHSSIGGGGTRSKDALISLGHQSNNKEVEGPMNEPESPATVEPQKLHEEILSLLGEDIPVDNLFSEPIQTDVASRWSSILAKGLEGEIRDKLVGKYMAPVNCQPLNPPVVNPEVKVAVSESVLRRDARLAHLQQQVGASMSAIGIALTNMLKDTTEENKECIQLLSDAGRLLANIHHSESMSRRELLAINLNKELKETLTNTPVNNMLFGNDLEDRIKTLKDLEKSSQQLKIQKKSFKITSKPSTSRFQENYRSPLFQKFRARKSGHMNRAPTEFAKKRQYQIQNKKSDSFNTNRRHRPRPY